MTNGIFLSICIPSRNRCSLLKQAILSVLQQDAGEEVEICISLNASDDGSEDMLKALFTQYKNIVWIKQPKLIAIDENMQQAAGLTQGDYVWLLGDDDLISPGGLRIIINECKKMPDLLLVQGVIEDACGNQFGHSLPESRLNLYHETLSEWFIHLWNYMKFGSLVVPGKVARRPYCYYDGTAHGYAGVIWDYLSEKNSECKSVVIKTINQPCAIYREVPKTYASYHTRVMFECIPKWFKLLPEKLEPGRTVAFNSYLSGITRAREIYRHCRCGQLQWSNRDLYLMNLPRAFRLRAKIWLLIITLFISPVKYIEAFMIKQDRRAT
jgi:glycosyltransferase involved in cell wall biosynthesis